MRLSLSFCAISCLIAITSAAPCTDFKSEIQCVSVSKCIWDTATSACKCGDTEADFIFLVDESGSVQQSGFNIQKSFLVDVLDQTVPANSSVGVAKFGNGVTQVISLQAGKNLNAVRTALQGMQWGEGATHMGDAMRAAMTWLQQSTKPNKIIFLATDGKPNGGSIPDPCALKDEIANTPGLHVVILGVSSGFSRSKVTCLVQKESVPDDWIITVTQYDPALLNAILPLLDGRFCPEGFQLMVTEVKMQATSPAQNTGDDAVFVEIVNQGTKSAPLNKISLGGVFSGVIAPPSDNRVLAPGQALVVYDTAAPQCLQSACTCTKTASPPYQCTNALYISCPTQQTCTFVAQALGMNLTNWYVSVSDATSTPSILVDTLTYDTSPSNLFPVASNVYTSYELNAWNLVSNDVGSSWTASCVPGGTPGDQKANCTTCIPVRCTSGGDRNATCDVGTNTCQCSGQFYLEGGVCLSLFPPRSCTAQLRKIRDQQYEVHFSWDPVLKPANISYTGKYVRSNGANSEFVEIGNSKEITDQNENVFFQAFQNGSAGYGTIRTQLRTSDARNVLTTYLSIETPCQPLTDAPTPSPTLGLTVLWAYFGGDICTPPQDRCSCLGQQDNCAGAGERISKTLVGDALNFMQLVRFPKVYPYDMQIQWVVYDSLTNLPQPGGEPPVVGSQRRLMSAGLPINTQVNCSAFDVCPPWNSTTLPAGDISQIAFGVNVKRTNKQYYIRIIACSSSNRIDPCIKVFPDQLLVELNGVAPAQGGGVINSNTTPDWLWWLLAALALLLALALFLAYRWWTRNKAMAGELDTTKKDLDQAITENELGFGHDLGGDVEFNPMATGVPGQQVVSDPYGTEIDGRRQIAGENRADVAIEKFGYRQQLGQVQQQNFAGQGQGY